MFSNNRIIGIDIGSESIKMVEINHSEKKKEISTYGIASHNIDLSGYWDNKTLKNLARVIENILDTGRFEGVKAVVSVMAKDVYVTTMDFDKNLSKKQISKEINSQAEYFLPYPPNEMRLSWSFIESNDGDSQRVLINALPDFIIVNTKNILEYVNLDGIAIENQINSQIRSLIQGERETVILVDTGGTYTVFNIIIDGKLRSSSHIDSGTDKISTEIADFLGIPLDNADYFKKDLGLVNLYHLPSQVVENMAVLKSELEIFIKLNEEANQKPKKIIFTGGGCYTPGFLNFFNDLSIPVEIGNPVKYIGLAEDIKPFISPVLNQLPTAIGLALKNNL